ncbi:MAG: biotin transporter BioY [Acidobacteriota bacterium]
MKRYILMMHELDRDRTGAFRAIISVFFFCILTALLSQVKVPLPFTPVPFTLQVLAVFLTGYFLSSRLAPLSMVLYLAAGLMGFPVFSGASAGFSSLAGPTGGYIVGFIPAALAIAYLKERNILRRFNFIVTIVSGMTIIYFFGLIHLILYVKALTGLQGSLLLMHTFNIGVFPFILIDASKGIIAASLYYGVMRRKGLF